MSNYAALLAGQETSGRFHLSENPLGASPAAVAVARGALESINRYPDPVHAELIRKIATHYGTGEDRVAVGNGTVAAGFWFWRRLTQGPAASVADRRHSLRRCMVTATRSASVQVRCAVLRCGASTGHVTPTSTTRKRQT